MGNAAETPDDGPGPELVWRVKPRGWFPGLVTRKSLAARCRYYGREYARLGHLERSEWNHAWAHWLELPWVVACFTEMAPPVEPPAVGDEASAASTPRPQSK
jgi:hypothetical protein